MYHNNNITYSSNSKSVFTDKDILKVDMHEVKLRSVQTISKKTQQPPRLHINSKVKRCEQYVFKYTHTINL